MGLSSIVKGFSVNTRSAANIARISATSQRLPWRQSAGGERAVAGSRDVFIKMAIGQVVKNHAETAHDKCAKDKHCQQGDRRAAVIR